MKANYYMKNILILHNSLNYNKSGVERVSFLLKEELLSRGYNCFEGCIKGENIDNHNDVLEYNFNNSRKHVLEYFITYINKHNINVIIIQSIFDPNINYTVAYLKKTQICKIVFCLHNAPSAYTRKNPLSIPEQVKIFLWYLLKFHNMIFDFCKYRLKMLVEMYNLADRFILLSNSYITELYNITKKQDPYKICVINNLLALQSTPLDCNQRKKQVLILGRLDDFQKNISSALRIWKLIENSGFYDWKLVIAGSGIDEKKLQDYAKVLKLKNVSFVGETSEPEKYFQESSLFMMTSHIEGWPMALLEAQQNGCVPVVFNTFAALSEIIENNINGCIIEKNNEKLFASKLLELMDELPFRQTLSLNCVKLCKKFSSKTIGEKWDSLLKSL